MIRTGEFRGIDLAGVKVAAVIVGESSLSAGPAPRKSVLFFDPSVTKAQQQAAQALLAAEYGALLGESLGIHIAPVEFHESAGAVHLQAGDLVSVSMRRAQLPDDAMKGARLWYDPFIPLTESHLATTLNSRFAGSDFGRYWDDTNQGVKGYYGRFAVVSR